jgi:hypothetical protein
MGSTCHGGAIPRILGSVGGALAFVLALACVPVFPDGFADFFV